MFGVYENFSTLIIIGQLIAYNQTLILSILFALPRVLIINIRGRANRIDRISVWLYAINRPIIINAEKFSYTPNINLKLKDIESIKIAWTLLISTLYLFISIIENTHGFSSLT